MFVGHTRFSLFNPGAGDWKSSSRTSSAEEAAFEKYLFSEERLAPRAEVFMQNTVPMLNRASERHRIRHVVSYSENLPAKYQEMLTEAAENHPFLVLDRKAPKEGASPWQSVVGDEIADTECVGAYRLDDDDLLADDFFDRMAGYIRDPFVGMWVTFANGYTAVTSEGRIFRPRKVTWPKIAIGLTAVHKKETGGKFVGPSTRGGHNRVDEHNAMVVDSREPSYLWLRSTNQDSLVNVPEAERLRKLEGMLHQYELASAADFRRSFPHLKSVEFGESWELLKSEKSAKQPIDFELPKPLNCFSIKYGFKFSGALDPRNYIMRFGIERDSEPERKNDPELGLGEAKDLASNVTGLSFSENPTVGFFKYLPLRRGKGEMRFSLSLPTGYVCTELQIREWKNPENPLKLTYLRVNES